MNRTSLSLLLAATVLTAGCGSGDDTSKTEDALCRLHTVDLCTQDCTWNEVLGHDAHCAVCARPGGSPDYQGYDVADCGSFHALRATGVDAGWIRFYDKGTGALVGTVSTGEPCLDGNVWPAGCESPDFKPYAAWCDAYRADGTGTKCCGYAEDFDQAYAGPGPTNVCSWSTNTTAACGDFNVSRWPDTSVPDGLYYDAHTGRLVAWIETRLGQTACRVGPAEGFSMPACPSPATPVTCPGN